MRIRVITQGEAGEAFEADVFPLVVGKDVPFEVRPVQSVTVSLRAAEKIRDCQHCMNWYGETMDMLSAGGMLPLLFQVDSAQTRE